MSKVTLESIAAEFRSGNSTPVERATFTRERMQEVLEAYADARVAESQQWQPIETAPQDGTPVLLFARLESAETSTRVVGSFILGEWLAQSYVGQNKAVLVPSHWIPLPPFPPLPGPASHNPIGHMTISTTRRKP